MKDTNEMEILFDSRSENEGFARVAVAAFMTQKKFQMSKQQCQKL